MNSVEAILHDLTDRQLREAVHELHALTLTGVMPDGVVRNVARRITDEVNVPGHDARTIAEHGIYRVAAHRWAGIKES